MKRSAFILLLLLTFAAIAFSQTVPRESQHQEIEQNVGDTKIEIDYHRPNVKGRAIWGELVPYGEVWRSGANENTTIEFSRDVTIDGKPLAAGKYGFHTIPAKGDWIVIFNKVNNEWGSFKYDEKNDALRVTVKPMWSADSRESLAYEFDNVKSDSVVVMLAWEKIRVPFTVNIGDVNSRVLAGLRKAAAERKADDIRPLITAANFVINNKMSADYDDASGWIGDAAKSGETFTTLSAKAKLFAAQGDTANAIKTGELAIETGKKATPPVGGESLNMFQKTVDGWKAKK